MRHLSCIPLPPNKKAHTHFQPTLSPHPSRPPPLWLAGAVVLVVAAYLLPLLVGLGVTARTADWELGYFAAVGQTVRWVGVCFGGWEGRGLVVECWVLGAGCCSWEGGR